MTYYLITNVIPVYENASRSYSLHLEVILRGIFSITIQTGLMK